MYTSVELLDMVKARYRLPSDYAAAPKIGLTRAQISRIRNNQSFFSADSALKIALLLDMDPLKVVASVQVESAYKRHDETSAEMWKHYAA